MNNKWSLCLVCNRRANYRSRVCNRKKCDLIWKYIGKPPDLHTLNDTIENKCCVTGVIKGPPKYKCRECFDTGIVLGLGGFDIDRYCSKGCQIKNFHD